MRMLNVLFIICGALMLSACQTTGTTITKQVPVVIKPPETLYYCPIVEKFPVKPTNKKVADLIVTLDKNNKVCHSNINAIKKYVNDTDKLYNSKKVN